MPKIKIANNAKITKKIDKPAINNWQKKVRKIKKVIPKSGWSIIKAEITINEKININKYDFLPWLQTKTI